MNTRHDTVFCTPTVAYSVCRYVTLSHFAGFDMYATLTSAFLGFGVRDRGYKLQVKTNIRDGEDPREAVMRAMSQLLTGVFSGLVG